MKTPLIKQKHKISYWKSLQVVTACKFPSHSTVTQGRSQALFPLLNLGMKCPPFFRLLCLLACILPPTFSKDCYFCEITASTKCPSTKMSCGEDEDCFVGKGAALGVSLIQNKGCIRSINCGKEQPVAHMGVTYSLVTNCCTGNLCNAAQNLMIPSLFLQIVFLICILLLGILWFKTSSSNKLKSDFEC